MIRLVACCLALSLAAGCAYSVDLAVPVVEAQSSRVFAADGSVIAALHAEQDREQVPLRDIAPVAQQAVIAIEDARFYSHHGVDLRALVRAATRNAQKGGVVEGGSTITQQYVKNVLLDRSRTGRRKLREAVLAYQLERKYTKRTILERYLNTIYLGNGAYGIQAAAHSYFGKRAADLGLTEAALLAGLVQAPERYDPRQEPTAATARRNVVLERMRQLHLITDGDAVKAEATPLGLAAPSTEDRYPAAYFVERVKRFVLDDPHFGTTAQERRNLLFQGGLRIETTLDPRMQALAEDAVAKTLSDPAHDPAGAVVAMDPRTGFVRALVGGRDFFGAAPDAKFDFATQGHRQTGSAFKPFVLAAALQGGIALDRVYSAPPELTVPLPRPQAPWVVHNFEGEGGAPMNLVEATVHSVNTVYAQLIGDVGPRKAVDLATAMGIGSRLYDNPAAVLGTNAVTVLDMASAYSTFAADGMHSDPVLVTKIARADGSIVYERPTNRHRVLPIEISRKVTGVLQEVVNRGTGVNARIGRPVAGKTGTAEKFQDAWFIGYTPELVAAVWVGFPDRLRPMQPPTTRITVAGGTWPAQIWQLFAGSALAETPASSFPDVPAPPASTVNTAAPTIVPLVVGMHEPDARAALTRGGFAIASVPRPSRDYPPGIVLSQTPVGGSAAGPGSTVTITVSSGPPPVVTVPDVLGSYADEAVATIKASNLVADVLVQSEPPPGSPARRGRVWKQSPAAGTSVDAGTTVTAWANPG